VDFFFYGIRRIAKQAEVKPELNQTVINILNPKPGLYSALWSVKEG